MDARPLTIVDVARYAARYWYIAIACFVAILTPFVHHAYTAPAIYRATVVMASATAQGGGLSSALGQVSGLAGLAGAAGLSTSRGADAEEALAVMRSRPFTSAFLEETHADAVVARQMGVPVPAPTDLSARTRIARYFDSVRSISQDKKTGLYQLSIEWTEPAAAALWANETVKRLNAVMRQRASERSQANQRYLQEEAARANQVDVRGALSRLLEAEIRQLMMAKVTPEYAFRVIDPATPPELDEMIRPNRRSIIAAGGLFAAFASLVIVAIIGILIAKPWRDRAA